MASSTANPARFKANLGSSSLRKVRIVGKIRDSTDSEIKSCNGVPTPWISVEKSTTELSDSVTISFADQTNSRKESCRLDYCYEQGEDIDQIFLREVMPLVSKAFSGVNASVIAYGARGSGKTYTIQGCDEKPGLAPLAMAEILSMCKEDRRSVTISCYEVYQDHVYDLLEPKDQEVLVLEDGVGKIQLKGLSQVPVKTISEFYKLYFNGIALRKPAQKVTNDVPRRSHKGLTVYISCNSTDSNSHLVSKMNFIDLAGYEDAKRKNNDGRHLAETSRLNKSLYALQNVVYALNANEMRIPFRESKITRILQDSLGGMNESLMLTCLNPFFCQDTVYTVSLASRSCQILNWLSGDSAKKTNTGVRPLQFCSPKVVRSQTHSVKRDNGSRMQLPGKKTTFASSARKLFNGTNPVISSEQASKIASASLPSLQEQEISLSIGSKRTETSLREEELAPTSLSIASKATEIYKPEKELAPTTAPNAIEAVLPNEDISPLNKHNLLGISTAVECNAQPSAFSEEDRNIEKENKNSCINEDGSPPLSASLKELSNSLKSLCSSTRLSVKMPRREDSKSCNIQTCTNVLEPKTPGNECSLRFNDQCDIVSIGSPLKIFSARSSQLKKSLVQEYFRFLNSASKEELKALKGIGEKRANYILELREESPEPFKDQDDLKDIGLNTKQINEMMKTVAGQLFC